MDLQFWPGAVTMVMVSAPTASFIINSGRSAWFIGALLLFIYAIFALTPDPCAAAFLDHLTCSHQH
jgi:Ca2+:H+ antiporter